MARQHRRSPDTLNVLRSCPARRIGASYTDCSTVQQSLLFVSLRDTDLLPFAAECSFVFGIAQDHNDGEVIGS